MDVWKYIPPKVDSHRRLVNGACMRNLQIIHVTVNILNVLYTCYFMTAGIFPLYHSYHTKCLWSGCPSGEEATVTQFQSRFSALFLLLLFNNYMHMVYSTVDSIHSLWLCRRSLIWDMNEHIEKFSFINICYFSPNHWIFGRGVVMVGSQTDLYHCSSCILTLVL